MKKILLYISAFLILILGIVYYVRADIYGPSLIAWYNMDNNKISGITLTDLSGSGNTGTLNGGAVSGSAGKLGQAVTFDGGNDYIDIGKGATLDLATTLSISVWVKTGGLYGAVVSDYDAVGLFTEYTLEIRSTNNASFYFANFSGGATSKVWNTANGSVSANIWHNVTATKNGTNDGDVIIYIDGVSSPVTVTGSGAVALFANVGNTSIGRYGSLDGGYYGGLVDDVRIYNRVLTAAEIQQIYLQGASVHFN